MAERSPPIRTAWHLPCVRFAHFAFPGYLITVAVEAEFRGGSRGREPIIIYNSIYYIYIIMTDSCCCAAETNTTL